MMIVQFDGFIFPLLTQPAQSIELETGLLTQASGGSEMY